MNESEAMNENALLHARIESATEIVKRGRELNSPEEKELYRYAVDFLKTQYQGWSYFPVRTKEQK